MFFRRNDIRRRLSPLTMPSVQEIAARAQYPATQNPGRRTCKEKLTRDRRPAKSGHGQFGRKDRTGGCRRHFSRGKIAARRRAGRLSRPRRFTAWARTPANGKAVAGIFAAKGRPRFNPLIVHVDRSGGSASAMPYFPIRHAVWADKFWPGALTLVLPRRADTPLSELVSAGLGTVALRVPAHPVAAALLQASRSADRRAQRQSFRRRQRHHRRPCRRGPGR